MSGGTSSPVLALDDVHLAFAGVKLILSETPVVGRLMTRVSRSAAGTKFRSGNIAP